MLLDMGTKLRNLVCAGVYVRAFVVFACLWMLQGPKVVQVQSRFLFLFLFLITRPAPFINVSARQVPSFNRTFRSFVLGLDSFDSERSGEACCQSKMSCFSVCEGLHNSFHFVFRSCLSLKASPAPAARGPSPVQNIH